MNYFSVWRDVQSSSMPIVLEEFQRRKSLLLMPSLEQTEKIKNRIGILSNPLSIMKGGLSGERHGPTQWQYDP